MGLRPLVDPSEPLDARFVAVASGAAAAFAALPILCELLSAQAGVLEHNISVDVATRHEQGARDSLLEFAELLRHLFSELDQARSEQGANLVIVMISSLWTHCHPAPAVRAVYDADPSFAFMGAEFEDALCESLWVHLAGLVAAPRTGPAPRA
ncbi:hypothetical protein [Streptomyces sp. R08]|uniref:Tetracyclin repressor-like C-terminal domain-containing protein n=1 Tax=Streptomyces sp. R08 TaxID=3238624 RepID=A0AB39MQS1_9ACTN